MTAEDSQRFTSVGSPAISPDDEWVLYTRSERDWEDDDLGRNTHIWRVRVDGTDARQLTFGENNTGSPAWFPDGSKIAFSSGRGESDGSQVFFMYTDGGEAWQATDHEGGVGQYRISPDGAKLLFTARDPLTDEQQRRQRMRDDAEVVDETFRMTHLWVFDIESGEETRLTEGDFTISDPQWAPDSSKIAYVTRPTTRSTTLPGATCGSWISMATPRSSSTTRAPTRARAGRPTVRPWQSRPSRSPQHAVVQQAAPVPGRRRRAIVMLQDFDRNFGAPMWSRDGKTIFWSTGDGTGTTLFGCRHRVG